MNYLDEESLLNSSIDSDLGEEGSWDAGLGSSLDFELDLDIDNQVLGDEHTHKHVNSEPIINQLLAEDKTSPCIKKRSHSEDSEEKSCSSKMVLQRKKKPLVHLLFFKQIKEQLNAEFDFIEHMTDDWIEKWGNKELSCDEYAQSAVQLQENIDKLKEMARLNGFTLNLSH